MDWYKFFFSVIFPGGTVGHQVSQESPIGNPFLALSADVAGSSTDDIAACAMLGSLDDDLEISSNVVGACHQLRSRQSRLNLKILDGSEELKADERTHRSSI